VNSISLGTPSTFQLSVRSHVSGESSTFVHLQWTQGLNKGITIYSLESDPPLDETLISNSNVLLHTSYNVRYNVTVTATNCEGNTNASIKLYFGMLLQQSLKQISIDY
jgi:hypothetical protein